MQRVGFCGHNMGILKNTRNDEYLKIKSIAGDFWPFRSFSNATIKHFISLPKLLELSVDLFLRY